MNLRSIIRPGPHRADEFECFHRLQSHNAAPSGGDRTQRFRGTRVGEFSGFGLVASKRGDLRLKRVGDVDEDVGTKYRFDALEGPLCGGRYLEGIDIAHALPT